MPSANGVTVSGGASRNDFLNYLKAELFNLPVKVLDENDTSALGALIIASGKNAEDFIKIKKIVSPDGKMRNLLLKRFDIYKKLYPALKDTFKELREM